MHPAKEQPPAKQQNPLKITTEVVRQKTDKGKLLNQYLKIKRIGQGPFSKIKLMVDVKDKNSTHYAMKKYNLFILKKKIKMGSKTNGQTKYSTQADQIIKEVQILKKLDHRNVVKLHEIIQDDEEEKIYLFMDYCKYGDIAQWDHKKLVFVTKWKLKNLAKFLKQASIGLQYLHSLNIVHRDLKPQNILIYQQQQTGQLMSKIIDFGRSVQLQNENQKLSGSQGTYHFMAPQMLSQKIIGGYNGKLCDIWSLGITIFCCVFGCLPFYDDNLMKLFQKIEKGDVKLPKHIVADQQKFLPLIYRMLQLDCNKRPPLKQITARLQQIQNSL